MKTLLPCLMLSALFIFNPQNSKEQILTAKNPYVSLTMGVGVSDYFGDLTESNKLFPNPSYSFSAGFSYSHNPHLNLVTDIYFSKIQASDSRNARIDLKARNLSFKSNILEFSATAEYNILDMTSDFKFTPYLLLGMGIMHYNPYTTDRFSNKVFLQPLGTEGQGLAIYPDRNPYALTLLNIPIGAGIKYAISNNVTMQAELKYRYVDTDYLDDVSNAGYPDKAALAAKNPILPMLTYRGDELPGGAPYPSKTSGLNRGNPKNRDSYYSGQIKVAIKLRGRQQVEINY